MRGFVSGLSIWLLFAASAEAAEPTVPRVTILDAMRTADCFLSYEEATEELPDLQELGDGHKLAEVPCWRAAYNMGSIFFVLDPTAPGQAQLLRFRAWTGNQFEEDYSLGNPEYDAAKRALHSYMKGRGLGDCGSAGRWVWSGREFVLEAYWLKEECDGEPFNAWEPEERWRVYPR